MQNHQLQTWLSEDEYAQLDAEWQDQIELREERYSCSDFTKLYRFVLFIDLYVYDVELIKKNA